MSTAANPFNPVPTLNFRLNSSLLSSKFLPRLGQLTLTRSGQGGSSAIDIVIPTPGLMCSTTRGVIQHLTRDNVKRSHCVKWVHVPFESFLQVDPPVPTRQEGDYPLHKFLGFPASRHILSLSLRDPADGREMPPNGKLFVAAQSSRGTRRVTCPAYRSYVAAVSPDIVYSLSDVPFTPPPHSQKRISKSIERSAQWLTTILAPSNLDQDTPAVTSSQNSNGAATSRLNVFVYMVGGINPAARAAFTAVLQEPLELKEKALLAPLETLDNGISGYVFDLVPLRAALLAERPKTTTAALMRSPASPWPMEYSLIDSFASLIKASLGDLPRTKPRLVNTALSPHEMLALIRDTGVDLFDTFWAQQAATWGIALDFQFPVPSSRHAGGAPRPKRSGKYDVGHNLYEERYAHDFGRLANSFLDGLTISKRDCGHSESSSPVGTFDDTSGETLALCACAACSPTWANQPLIHSIVDKNTIGLEEKELAHPYTRAYLHHLLHTHEMSAHALLVMHNLTVMDVFMRGVRSVLQQERDLDASASSQAPVSGKVVEAAAGEVTPATLSMEKDPSRALSLFATEVARFEQTYDTSLVLLDEARACWAEVDRARGKGRLAREREKMLAEGVDVPLTTTTMKVEGEPEQ